MPPTCCVKACSTTRGVFYRFPAQEKNINVLEKWFRAIGPIKKMKKEDFANNLIICIKHFEKRYQLPGGRLVTGAVPTLHIPPLKLPLVNNNSKTSAANSQQQTVAPPKITVPSTSQSGVVDLTDEIEETVIEEIVQTTEEVFIDVNGPEEIIDDGPSCEIPDGHECRVCAKTNVATIPIFEGDGLKNDLVGLMNKHLPITVSKTDQKSQQTCLNCVDILEKWDQLTQTCVKSDEQFRNREPEEKKKLLKRVDFFLNISPANFDSKSLFLRDVSKAPPKTSFEKQLPSIVCRKCNFEFYGKEWMDAHFCVCKEMQCCRCLILFNSLRSLYSHFISCTSCICRGCGLSVSSLNALRQHEGFCRQAISKTKITLQCKRCGVFRTQYLDEYVQHVFICDAVDHLDIIMPVTPYKDNCYACRLCLQPFGCEFDLAKHNAICSLYVCDCSASFHNLMDLVEHSLKCYYVIVSSSFDRKDFKCETMRLMPALTDPEVTFKNLRKRPSVADEPITTISDDEDCAEADGGPDSSDEARPEPKSALDHHEAEMEDVFTMLQRESFTKNSDLKCYLCKLVCESKTHLRDHLMIAHQAAKLLASRYFCEVCKVHCRSIDAFNLHSYNRHTSRMCMYCEEQFPTFLKLNLHMKELHFKGNKKGCQICRKLFPKTELQKHRDWHYLEEKLSCEVCQKVVIGAKRYTVHMSEHRCNEPILCFECGAMVPKYQYPKHLQSHKKKTKKVVAGDRKERVECEICGRMIVTSKLLWHMRRMHSVDSSKNLPRTGKNKFVCQQCCRAFPQKNLLDRHMHGHEIGIIHGGFKCHFCAMGYKTKKNLDSHIRSYHEFEEPHCPICDIRFESIQEKYLHRRMEHSYAKFEYMCCELYFPKISLFQTHFFERHNDGITQFVGRYKDKKVTQYRYHLTYVKNDKGEPRIKVACGHCGKETTNMLSNNIHIRNIHIGIRPYHCSYCRLAFKTQTALTHHEYIHLDLKPYKCTRCHQTFRQPNDLKKHEKRHDRDYAFSDATVVPKKRKRFEQYTA